jgi:hypothetical protein
VLLDFALFAGALLVIGKLWARYYFGQPEYFQSSFYLFNIPLYTLTLVIAMYLNGAYDAPFTRKSSWHGFVSGILMILVIYAILPADLRTSRMVILLSSITYLLLMIFTRSRFLPWKADAETTTSIADRKAIIVAGTEEAGRIKELINRSKDHIEIVGTVSPESEHLSMPVGILGHVAQLEDIVRVHKVKEVIFSAQDVPFSTFTGSMTKLGPSLRYMLAATTTMNIVGSMSRDTEGESYAIRIHFNLSDPSSKRAKRLFDIGSSIVVLLMSPILIWFLKHRLSFFKNLFKVMLQRMTWVSYHPVDPMVASLPVLLPGVLHPAYPEDEQDIIQRLRHIHYVYARDYHWTTDLSILTSQITRTGQTKANHEQ